ncbi:MAG: proline--tRNA ligase [Nanoarchaeota archaeon]
MAKINEKDEQGLKYKKSQCSDWYTEVVQKTELADYAAIAGCIVFRPYSYAIWEKIREIFDKMIKETGHENAYFPLFIPERFLKKEADHFSGFIPEVAFIEKKEDDSERYALRPTSETIIYDSYAKWIRSWRDLPLLLNQWCNIVRWEVKATRPFLRTREFLWQEGHTVHISEEEAEKEVTSILSMYVDLIQNYLAIPVLTGKKTETEKFAGALRTYTLESLMPDGKALQMGTSHNLGQNFAIAFNVNFVDKNMKEKYAWTTSWGISTRLIGALIMMHGDDKGLILPPKIAPIQAVIVPIYKSKNKKEILKAATKLKKKLGNFSVKIDDRDYCTPGWKFNEWEMKGVPLRIEIGPKDIKQQQAILVRRDTGEKEAVKLSIIKKIAIMKLEQIQNNLFKRAKKFLDSNIYEATNFKSFEDIIKKKKGMAKAKWCGESKCEEEIKDKTGATTRLIISGKKRVAGKCVHCSKKAKETVYFAKAY